MQDLLNNFGVNFYLLGAQIVNFLIILYLLKRFAYNPIFKMLDARRKTIAEGVKNAEESAKVLEKALEEEKEILKKAQNQAQLILAEAGSQAQQTIAEAESNAKVRVEKILQDANRDIQKQTQEAQKYLATQTTKFATELLEKSLSGLISDKEQKEVVMRVTKKLKV